MPTNKIYTVDSFLASPDEEKQTKWFIAMRDGRKVNITLCTSNVYCNSCGSMPDKGIQVGTYDAKLCFQCFRSNHIDSNFLKE